VEIKFSVAPVCQNNSSTYVGENYVLPYK